jgi:hypothetical protein
MVMHETERDGPILHACLCEIERGLFRVTYRVHGPKVRDLPLYQTGTCAADVQRSIEVSAHASGYPTVMWDPLP